MPCLRHKSTDPLHRVSSGGFTIIEIVIAVAIVAIIAGFAAGGGMRSWLIQRGLSEAVEQLRGDLQRAKLLAIKEHANCTITLNQPAVDQYTVSLNNQVVNLNRYRGGVIFTGPSAVGTPVITFTPWGTAITAVCADAEVHLTNGAGVAAAATGMYRLRVSGSGSITKQIWGGANWISLGI
jgi:prepilin-type N-terminal cleavage/methylation domain-containing protein